METVNWILAITVFFLIALVFVLSTVLMAVLDKKDSQVVKNCLLSEENKQLIKENERLSNHIFILEEIEQKK